MTSELAARCEALISALGLGAPGDVTNVTALTGGVASDIAALDVKGQQVCVKFALPKLKVAADWFAPVHRNAAEYAWLQAAAKVMPECAIKLFGRSDELHGFAMEFVSGPDVYLWKAALLDQAPDQGEAAIIGDMVGRLHAASTNPGFDVAPFQNRDDFRAIRIEPYLSFTASQHPDLAGQLTALADQLYSSNEVLVHGDVSPKNILFRGAQPVILDAECATMGDASFDPAFCLNHLVLKAAHLQGSRERLLGNAMEFWQAYRAHVTWVEPMDLEKRVSQLLPAFMLARIDGKSPVEYLDEAARENLRAMARALISHPENQLGAVLNRLKIDMKEWDA